MKIFARDTNILVLNDLSWHFLSLLTVFVFSFYTPLSLCQEVECPHPRDVFLRNFSGMSLSTTQKILNINQELTPLFNKLYCLDHRSYFEVADRVITKEADTLDEDGQEAILLFHSRNHMDESNSTLRNTGGDARRIDHFASLFSKYRQGLTYSPNDKLKNTEFIFVAGFGNELFKETYFLDIENILIKNFAVPQNQIHTIYPGTLQDSKTVNSLLKKQYDQIRSIKPDADIIMVGHSRGGLVIVSTVLTNPTLLDDQHLVRLVTLQSPLKGTVVADVAQNLLEPIR